MNQSFRLKSEEIRRNNITSDSNQEASYKKYQSAGHVRNISLVLLDGTRVFLNYAYLLSCMCDPSYEYLELIFTSHKVVIKGLRLKQLYYDLLTHSPLELECSNSRYNSVSEGNEAVINDIQLTDN